jgi:hypothetical protein
MGIFSPLPCGRHRLTSCSFSSSKVPSQLPSASLFRLSSQTTPQGGLTLSTFGAELIRHSYSTKWLSERELHVAQGRLVKDVGLLDNPDEAERSGSGAIHGLKLAVTDPKVWALA